MKTPDSRLWRISCPLLLNMMKGMTLASFLGEGFAMQPLALPAVLASDVHTVMCNGRLLYHKGQHLTMDYEKIRGEMGKVLDKIY